MKTQRLLPLASLLALAALPALAQLPASNPFAAPSTLPFQAPPFDRIKVADYQPAIEEGMKIQRAEMEAIATDPAPPTFANTIEAMEKTGVLLTRTYKVFSNIEQSDTNEGIQKIKSEVVPKLSALNDAIYLNPKLYARVKAIYAQRATLGLDPEAKYLVERYNLAFVRAGADLSDADKKTLMALNEEESKLDTAFEEKLLADTNASAPVVSDRKRLAGATEGQLAAAADAAKERKLDGKWVLALQNTTQQPVLSSLTDRALRQQVLAASEKRGDHGGENDTTAIVARLAQLRAQKAKLLGFKTYADYVLDDQMAKTPENANKLMNDLVPASTAKARGEAARIQKQIDAEKGGFPLSAADWELYSEKVRKAEYDIDESEVRPYFELDRVLNDGVFYAANKMYGITFKPRPDIPVYHPDVRVWEVFDADGKSLALFYGDYYQRPSKQGGAWCDTFVDQSRLMGTKPVVTNNLNLTKPAAGQPALISFADATVVFHEFGHALHAMFQNITYPTLAQTTARLRRVPVAVQRALGDRADRLRQLREAPQDRRADAGRPRREDQEGEDLQPGLHDDRVPRGRPARHGLALAALRRAETGRERFREGNARARDGRARRGAAAVPHHLLRAHLGRGVRRGLLRLPLGRGHRRRRVLLVQGERRDDARRTASASAR